MKLVILLGVATSIYPAEFLYRDINQPEFEIPNVLEVLRAEVEEKFVDQPILIRPKAVLVKPNINWIQKSYRSGRSVRSLQIIC